MLSFEQKTNEKGGNQKMDTAQEETKEETKEGTQIRSPLQDLIERAQRTNEPYEATEEEFRLLLTEGKGQINGIHDAHHTEREPVPWKTQLWVDVPDKGKVFFYVFTSEAGKWGKPQ